jgi:hypothetical protein
MGTLTPVFRLGPCLSRAGHLAVVPSGRGRRVAGRPPFRREPKPRRLATHPPDGGRSARPGVQGAHPEERPSHVPLGRSETTDHAAATRSWPE